MPDRTRVYAVFFASKKENRVFRVVEWANTRAAAKRRARNRLWRHLNHGTSGYAVTACSYLTHEQRPAVGTVEELPSGQPS